MSLEIARSADEKAYAAAAAELERQWEMNRHHTAGTWGQVARAVVDAYLQEKSQSQQARSAA